MIVERKSSKLTVAKTIPCGKVMEIITYHLCNQRICKIDYEIDPNVNNRVGCSVDDVHRSCCLANVTIVKDNKRNIAQ